MRSAVPSSAEPQPRRAAPQGAPASAAAAAAAAAGHVTVVPWCCTSQPSHDSGPECDANTGRRLGACSERPQASPDSHDSAADESPAACCRVSDSASLWLVQQHDPISTGAVAHNRQPSRSPSPARPGRAGHSSSSSSSSSSTAAAKGRKWHQGRLPAPHALHAAVLAVLAVCAAGTEINTAVSIFGPWDYELRQDGTSRRVPSQPYGLCRDGQLFLPCMLVVAFGAPHAVMRPYDYKAAAASLCPGLEPHIYRAHYCQAAMKV